MSLVRPLLGLRSPAGRRGRLSILIFHRVLTAPDPLDPDELDARRFDRVCAWLASWFRVLPLGEAVRALRNGDLPARAAAITFDDGYADNHDVALPILTRHGLPATFFIATGFLDGGRMFNDSIVESVRRATVPRVDVGDLGLDLDAPVLELSGIPDRRLAVGRLIRAVKYMPPERRTGIVDEIARRCRVALPDDLMMRTDQLKGLRRAGMEIGAHTVNHPILARLPAEAARAEIADSRRRLQGILGDPIGLFAYPNGKPGEDYHAETVELVRALGFDAAVSTAWGAAGADSDPFQLPRFTPWDARRQAFGWRLVANYSRSARVHAPPAPNAGAPS